MLWWVFMLAVMDVHASCNKDPLILMVITSVVMEVYVSETES